ncbi:hypothetical protein RAS1_42600 [Phycisphaerae bacterium RAS1]|nr:hypothetical protein RAS1_42600 [Phycisphaerae bacterium RAS1]
MTGKMPIPPNRFKWNGSTSTSPGFLVRWLDPGNWLAVYIQSDDGKARLDQRKDDGAQNNLVTAGSAVSLTATNWYTAKVVIGDDLGNSALQRLRFLGGVGVPPASSWPIDRQDADPTRFGNDSALIDTTVVDDDWSGGYVGLFRSTLYADVQQFDDFKVGYDNNADLDIDDGGDDIQIDDDFNSGVISLTYDNNGNLTDDGIHKYAYDSWNRLILVKRIPDATTTLATYAYDGLMRRMSKVVANCGTERYANDGGNTTVHFYYGACGTGFQPMGGMGVSPVTPWNIFETRNGSNYATRQWVWGTQYVDELVLMDVNSSPGASDSDCDPDTTPGGDGTDARYFYHQDRNWNVVALTGHDTTYSSSANGKIVERHVYTPYGDVSVYNGYSSAAGGEVAAPVSQSGNMISSQGHPLDAETRAVLARRRYLATTHARFMRRDPLFNSPISAYVAQAAQPTSVLDSTGLVPVIYEFEPLAALQADGKMGRTFFGSADGRSQGPQTIVAPDAQCYESQCCYVACFDRIREVDITATVTLPELGTIVKLRGSVVAVVDVEFMTEVAEHEQCHVELGSALFAIELIAYANAFPSCTELNRAKDVLQYGQEDYLFVGHSQGANILLHVLNHICNRRGIDVTADGAPL